VSSGAVGDGAPGFEVSQGGGTQLSSLDGQNVMENPWIFQDENWGTGPINWKPPYGLSKPIGSIYAIYGNLYHQYTPNVSIYIPYMDPMGNVFSWLINRNSKKCRFLFGL